MSEALSTKGTVIRTYIFKILCAVLKIRNWIKSSQNFTQSVVQRVEVQCRTHF